jgi:hypothetical protein
LRLLEPLLFHNDLEELPALSELHYQVKIVVCLNNLIKLHNVGMMHLFEDFDLPRDAVYVLLFLYPRFLQDFDRYLE